MIPRTRRRHAAAALVAAALALWPLMPQHSWAASGVQQQVTSADADADAGLPGPLAGSDDPISPASIEAGSVQGVLAPDGESGSSRYYRYERVLVESTVHVGTLLPTAPGTAGLEVSVATADGTACERGTVRRSSTSAGTDGLHIVVPGTNPDEDDPSDDEVACATASALEITVQPGYADREGASTRFALRVAEEPALVDTDGLPAPGEQAEYAAPDGGDGEVEPIDAGTFAAAPVVTTGVYSSSVTVGGPDVVFAVPLAWGQTLAARIAVRPYSGPQADDVGSFGPQLALDVLDPLLAPVNDSIDDLRVSTEDTGYAATTAGPVRWLDRVDGEGPALAGVHYLVVSPPSAASADEPLDEDGVEVPFGLVVEVRGEPSGEPHYRDDAEVVGGVSGPPGTETVADGDRGDVPGADGGGLGAGRWALLAALVLAGVGSSAAGVRLLRR